MNRLYRFVSCASVAAFAGTTLGQQVTVFAPAVHLTASCSERVCSPFCTADFSAAGTALLPKIDPSMGPIRSAEVRVSVSGAGTFLWNIQANHEPGGYAVGNPAVASGTAPGVTGLSTSFVIPDCGKPVGRFEFEGRCDLSAGGNETPFRAVAPASRAAYRGSGDLSIPVSVRFTPQLFFSGLPFMSWHQDMAADVTVSARYTYCGADFNGDGTVDFFDYDAFVNCFTGMGCPPDRTADFDHDTSVDFFDYDAFVRAFEVGC